MSSFFNRQPELFDTTKKFGAGTSSNGGGGNNNNTSTSSMKKGSGSNLAAAGLAMMAEKPLGPDEIDSVPGFLKTIQRDILRGWGSRFRYTL